MASSATFGVVPPRAALSYVDDGGPENMNIPRPAWINSYPVNAGGTTYYWDPIGGNDANSGLAAGLATLTMFGASGIHATVAAGDTVLVLALVTDAVVTEGAGSWTKTFNCWPHPFNLARVLWDPRVDLSGATWVQDSASLWHTTFTSPARWANAADWTNLRTSGGNNSSFPSDSNCVYAMPLTIDGQIVKGCGSTGAVDATHHFHAFGSGSGSHLLYIGVDPAGKTIKAPLQEYAFAITGTAAPTIKGMIFRCYSPNYNGTQAMVKLGGTGAWRLENCIFGFSSSDNVNVLGSATSGMVSYCHSIYGQTGYSMQSSVTGHTYYACWAYRNNTIWRYNQAWHNGGFKCAIVSGIVIMFCTSEENVGPGLWLDGNGGTCNNITFADSLCLNNSDIGILLEKVAAGNATTNAVRLLGNVCQGSWCGIQLLGGSNLGLLHNTLGNNHINLYLTDDTRSNRFVSASVTYENNLHTQTTGAGGVAGTSPQLRQLHGDDFSGTPADLKTIFASFKNNAWHLDGSVSMTTQFSLDNGTSVISYADRTAFVAATSLDANGITSTASGDPYLINPQGGDWAPKPTGAHVGAGKTITTLQRDGMGVWAGNADTVAPTIGAFIHPGGRGVSRSSFWELATRADTAGPVGTSTSGHAPTAAVGTWGVSSGKVYSSTDADGDVLTWSVGRHDAAGALVEGTLNSATVYRVPCLLFKGVAANTFLEAVCQNGGLALYKCDGGVYSQLGSTGAMATTNGTQYAIEARVSSAGVVTLYGDGVLKVTYTLLATERKYLGGQLVGGHERKAGAPGTAGRLDSLWATRG